MPASVLLAVGLSVGAAEGASDCSRWSVQGIRTGAAGNTLETMIDDGARRWRKLRVDENPPRSLYRLGARDGSEGQRESLLVAQDQEGDRITAVTWVIEKPGRRLVDWAGEYEALWGAPILDRYVIATGDRMVEASVWVDTTCDVKATLLAERFRTSRGFRFQRLAIRVEYPGDPTGHLNMLLLKVRNLED